MYLYNEPKNIFIYYLNTFNFSLEILRSLSTVKLILFSTMLLSIKPILQ